jgi:hypothetical protein
VPLAADAVNPKTGAGAWPGKAIDTGVEITYMETLDICFEALRQ